MESIKGNIPVLVLFFLFGCGGESDSNTVLDPPASSAQVSQCDYSWEIPASANAPMLPIFSGTVCTSNVSTCKSDAIDYAASTGWSIMEGDVNSTISQVNSCTDVSGSVSNIPNPNTVVQTLYGIGATSIGDVVSILSETAISELRKSGLTRDPLQIVPNVQEVQHVQLQDNQRVGVSGPYILNPPTGTRLLQMAGINASSPLYVEDDMRFNPVMGSFGGGHAGHSYFTIDGKLIDIMREVADYFYYLQTNQTFDSVDFALDSIIACHVFQWGSRGWCLYPPTPNADYIFESMYGAIIYHEFAHYFLMHAVDTLRAQLAYDPSTLFLSIQEDDADFIAGALLRKANLDLPSGYLMFDLMTLYSIYKGGTPLLYSQLSSNYQLQFTSNSPRYSPLASRKQNFERGYLAY